MEIEFSEQDLEDYLVDHLELINPELRFLGRQVPTIAGVIDILAEFEGTNLVIIELKKGNIDDKAVGQIMRYRGSILTEMCWWMYHFVALLRDEHAAGETMANLLNTEPPITCMLVGSGVEPNCALGWIAPNFHVYSYELTLGGLQLHSMVDRIHEQVIRGMRIVRKPSEPVKEWTHRFLSDATHDYFGTLEEAEAVMEAEDILSSEES